MTSSEIRTGGNFGIGWASLAVGALMGMVLGLWSFDGPLAVPEWIGAYDTTPRRLLRLGHIAFFGLGILNILLAQHMPQFGLSTGQRRAASICMNFGNILLPVTLVLASILHPLKYLMAAPATAVTIALALAAYGALGRPSARGMGADAAQPGAIGGD